MRSDERGPVAALLEETGLPFAEVAFNNPPGETYAVWSEEVARRGADTLNCITERDVSVEVYAYDFHDAEAIRRVSRALDRRRIEFTKYDTTFVDSEHLWCTRFEFSLVEKDTADALLDAEYSGFNW